MDREERIARAMETGEYEGLSSADRNRIAKMRDLLRSETVWEEPPAELGDRIIADVAGPPTRRGRWLWAVAAAIVLVAGTVGVMSALESPPREPVAVIEMAGTQLAPEAFGSADLFETPNGWAISFEPSGLPPAEEGTFYQGWVNNGLEAVAVGTFHMRGDEPTPIALWSGVSLREYRTLNVTLQAEGEGPESSGKLVMTGAVEGFVDE